MYDTIIIAIHRIAITIVKHIFKILSPFAVEIAIEINA
jgi:hypothetical protein